MCVPQHFCPWAERNLPHLTRQFSVLPKLLIFIWCGLLSHCTLENCLNRCDHKETGIIVRPGLKIQSMPFSRLVHRRKQFSMSINFHITSSLAGFLPWVRLFGPHQSSDEVSYLRLKSHSGLLETNRHPHFLPLYGQKSKMTTLWECFHLVENDY